MKTKYKITALALGFAQLVWAVNTNSFDELQLQQESKDKYKCPNDVLTLEALQEVFQGPLQNGSDSAIFKTIEGVEYQVHLDAFYPLFNVSTFNALTSTI